MIVNLSGQINEVRDNIGGKIGTLIKNVISTIILPPFLGEHAFFTHYLKVLNKSF